MMNRQSARAVRRRILWLIPLGLGLAGVSSCPGRQVSSTGDGGPGAPTGGAAKSGAEGDPRGRDGAQKPDVTMGTGLEKSGVTLRGAVVDLAGTPVPQVAVRVSEAGSARSGGSESGVGSVRTDAQGRFELAGAPTGPVRILVAAPRGGATEYGQAILTTTIGGGPVVELPPIRIAEKKVKTGEPAGDLGFALQMPRPGSDPAERKLVVALARPGGPAEIAGLRAGDEIVAVNGEDVTGDRRYLYPQLVEVPVGEVVRLGLARGVTVTLTTTAPP